MRQEGLFHIPDYSLAGIYTLVNRDKMKAYVGQSRNIKVRAEQHEKQLSEGTHTNKNILLDKGDDFYFLILHKFYNNKISDEELSFYELMYMFVLSDEGFELYNSNNSSEIEHRICCNIAFNVGMRDNLKDAYYDQFRKHFSYDVLKAKNKR